MRKMRGIKRILTFVLAMAMMLGDVSPVLATELTENTGGQKSTVSTVLEETIESETSDSDPAQTDDDPAQTDGDPVETDDELTEDKDDKTGPEENGAEPAEGTLSGNELPAETSEEIYIEEDLSEYILQAGGNGLPLEESGSALFAATVDDVIAAALKKRASEIDISRYGLTFDQLRAVYTRMMNHNPGLFYVYGGYSCYTASNGKVTRVVPYYLSEYTDIEIEEYNRAVAEAMKSVNDQMSEVEKALALHDYLVQHCQYEKDGNKGDGYEKYNAYNALVEGVAVCQGYTMAYTELLQQAGIPCSYATSKEMNHIWNVVQLDDKWYHVDTTWDDPVPDCYGRVYHTNFLCSDAGIGDAGSGHYGWVTGISDVTCEDDTYATGQFWNGLEAAVYFEGSTCYYLVGEGTYPKTGKIKKRLADGTTTDIYDLKYGWPVWGQTYCWSLVFSGLSRKGDYLYCNDKDSVYRVSISTGKAEEIYSYDGDGGEGYLYGSCVQGKDLLLTIAKSPNDRPPTRLKVALPETLWPMGEKTYEWTTVDGGTVGSSVQEDNRMKLLVFAPYYSYGYLRDSFYGMPLLQDDKYLDVVILDTSKGAAATIINEGGLQDYKNSYPNAPITYCYDTTESEETNKILSAYAEYRDITEMAEYTEDTRRNYVTCFLIDKNNRIVYAEEEKIAYGSNYGYQKLLDHAVSEINEKRYLKPEKKIDISFRKDGSGNGVFEWDKNAGVKKYILYSDVERAKVVSRDCEKYETEFAGEDDEYGYRDEGYAGCEIMNREGVLLYHQLVLMDKYGLYMGVSGVERAQGNKAGNIFFAWDTTDGTTVYSWNSSSKKMKVILFMSMSEWADGMSSFFHQPLFRGKDYIDVVVLDTSKLSKEDLKSKKEYVEKYNYISGSSYVMNYCYDTSEDGMKNAFESYCSRLGVTEEFAQEKVAYFLVDQSNQIVKYRILDPKEPAGGFNPLDGIVFEIVDEIREKEYLKASVAAPKLQIKENKEGRITLSWNKVSGASGYEVYRRTTETDKWFSIGSTPVDSSQHVTEYTDTGVSTDENGNNATYQYRVAAFDQYWVEGKYSNVVSNAGMETAKDQKKPTGLHLVGEDGEEITSLDLQADETKRVYLELECYDGTRVRIERPSYSEWQILQKNDAPYNDDANDVNNYTEDRTDTYALWWYERLTDKSNVNVTGKSATGESERFIFADVSGTYEGRWYSFHKIIPIMVVGTGTGAAVDMTLKDCYTDRDELNAYVRGELAERKEKISFCVPEEQWKAWGNWTPERDAMDFYEDHEGMKSWEGDYLFYAVRDMDYPLSSPYTNYKGKDYRVYEINLTYWDTKEQEEKVTQKLNELIWQPGGALYQYHEVPEYEIVNGCMSWIRKNVSYIGTTDYRYHSAYSALFNKKATCEGYSLLLYRMLREFGISNRILMGMDENAHTYNIVEMEGLYYYTDPTSGAMLKGSDTFKHADWQQRFLEDEFTQKVTSRISKTDYKYVPKYVQLYEIDEAGTKTLVDTYKTLAAARIKMRETSGKTYLVSLLGDVSMETGDELESLEGVEYRLSLNGHTLTVQGGENVKLCVDIDGGGLTLGTAAEQLQIAEGARVAVSDITLTNGTIENRGYLASGSLQITKGKLINEGTAKIETVGSMKRLENKKDALFIAGSFIQKAGDTMLLAKGSVMAVGEKAVIYNAELGGAAFYQAKGSEIALEGNVTLSEEVPADAAGLQFAMLSKDTFDAWWNDIDGPVTKEMTEAVQIIDIAPQTILFTTKTNVFPTNCISVRQKTEGSNYTKVYQVGQYVRVGREWIVIYARKMDGNEQHLRSFFRWSDAVAYLSNLSNPSMTYIVEILDDLDIEQGLTMPAKSAGLVIRGVKTESGSGHNALTVAGDLNVTTPLEFSGIDLVAKKNADYSAVKLNGMSLTLSDGAKTVFASVNGNASSALVLNGKAEMEVRGVINVGELRSDGGGTLVGLAALKRDKSGNITSVTPQITVSGRTDIRNGKVVVGLQEKVTENKKTVYKAVDFSTDGAKKVCQSGVQLLKSATAKPDRFTFDRNGNGETEEGEPEDSAILTKKNGYLVYYGDFESGVILKYIGEDNTETRIPFKTFADAVSEINNLKQKHDYTIQIRDGAADLTKASPAALTMPNKNYISNLTIESEGGSAELYYLGNITLTADTVLRDVGLKQAVKSGNAYADINVQKEGYPTPVNLSTGGFNLSVEGKVTFNTPLNLNGGNKGTLSIIDHNGKAALVTVTNGIEAEDSSAGGIIAGSVKSFRKFDVSSAQSVFIREYGTKSAKGALTKKAAELNVADMAVAGTVSVEGNVTVKELLLEGGSLLANGDKAGKLTLTNVTLRGSAVQLQADREFVINGTLENNAAAAKLTTRQKAPVKGAVQMPYLNIGGKVTTGSRITVRVLPNDCAVDKAVKLTEAPKASGQLLTAKTAGAECFRADEENIDSENAEDGAAKLYGPDNPNGYIMAKSGSNIYLYTADQVAVALCKGNDESGNSENAVYYPGWPEAVAALNAQNAAKESYTLLLLKDIGEREKPVNLTLPAKAADVRIASANGDEKQSVFYQNNLALGTNTVFDGVNLEPVTVKGAEASLAINTGNFALTLQDVSVGTEGGGSLKAITGKGKSDVALCSNDLRVQGDISGVSNLSVLKNATAGGNVKAATLCLAGEAGNAVTFEAKGAVTVTDIETKDGTPTLIYGRTAKNTPNLTVNGEIRNADEEHQLQLKMRIPADTELETYKLTLDPLKEAGYKAALSDVRKLAAMPKAATSDFTFAVLSSEGHDEEMPGVAQEQLVKAGDGLYLAAGEAVRYSVELKAEKSGSGADSEEESRTTRCLDLTQAVNMINTLSDGTAKYTLYLSGDCADTNLTDSNLHSALTMPGKGKAGEVTLTGQKPEDAAEAGAKTAALTFSGNIIADGNVTFTHLTLHPVKSASGDGLGDCNITVTGTAKSGGASLTLDQVSTVGDQKWNWNNQSIEAEQAGFINQISGTKNVTDVTVKNSKLRLKTGISNVDTLALTGDGDADEPARLITCKASTVNKLSVNNAAWDALGASTIADIVYFSGDDSYIAGKQDAKGYPQLTLSGKIDGGYTAACKVIAESKELTTITYIDSYKDAALLKAPKEAAGKFKVLETEPLNEVTAADQIYYKDTADYVIFGDRKDMAVRLSEAGSGGEGNTDSEQPYTYAKSYPDAVAVVNSLNDVEKTYRLELLKDIGEAEKPLTFTLPAKAAAVCIVSEPGERRHIFYQNALSLGTNTTFEQVALHPVSKGDAASLGINAGNYTLVLRDIAMGEGCSIKSVTGKGQSTVILDSEGINVPDGISGVGKIIVLKDAAAGGNVKAATLCLTGEAGNAVTFEAKGAVTVTDIENRGDNRIVYGRTEKDISNLTVNGEIRNETGDRLQFEMRMPEGKAPEEDYALTKENVKGVDKVTLKDTKKLATMPKAAISDFMFAVSGGEAAEGYQERLVKAGNGLYLVSEEVSGYGVELKAEKDSEAVIKTKTYRCLDLTQAVNMINALSDGTAKYTLYLSGDCADTNLTDSNLHSVLTMPGKGKAGDVTLTGQKPEDAAEAGAKTAALTFSGNITADGNVTFTHLTLHPVKSASGDALGDCNITVTGTAKSGASLTLDQVSTAGDQKWDWNTRSIAAEQAGFINQISGTKNVTNVTVKNSKLRLKTGISNADTLVLEADTGEPARLITCKASAVNKLSVNNGTWDALGAVTIAEIICFSGDDSYIAGKQDAKGYPQFTLNGKIDGGYTAVCKVIGLGGSVTKIEYVSDHQDVKLVKALKESANRFAVDGVGDETKVYYKDAAGYVTYGNQAEMAVKIIEGSHDGTLLTTYAKCYQDAVAIINNRNETGNTYELVFADGKEILTGKEGKAYAALTLPSKTAGITLRGEEGAAGKPVLFYTGTLKPACPVTFKDITLSEGAVKKNIFTPAYQITLAAGNGNAAFHRAETVKNPDGSAEEKKADLVFASAKAGKNKVILRGEKVYAKGAFNVENLSVAGDVVLAADHSIVLTNIARDEAEKDGADARLVLDVKGTKITKAGQESVTQLTLKGKMEDVKIGIAPQTYDFSEKAYHRLTSYEARALRVRTAKPNNGQKIASVSKNFVSEQLNDITLLYSYEPDWTEVGNNESAEKISCYLYNNGIYIK